MKKGLIRVEGAAVLDSENRLVFREANKTRRSRRTVPIMIPELKKALQAVPESERVGRVYKGPLNGIWEGVNEICLDLAITDDVRGTLENSVRTIFDTYKKLGEVFNS